MILLRLQIACVKPIIGTRLSIVGRNNHCFSAENVSLTKTIASDA